MVSSVLTAINSNSPLSERDVADAREEFDGTYFRRLLWSQLSARFGIVCFSSDPYNPRLWALYTGDASGFVVAYDKEQIARLTVGGGLQAVEYFRDPPVLLLEDELTEDTLIPL